MSKKQRADRTTLVPNLFLLCCVCVCVCAQSYLTLAIPWTVAQKFPLSMGLSRQEYWSGLLFPPPGELTNPGIKPTSPALAGGFFITETPGKPTLLCIFGQNISSF